MSFLLLLVGNDHAAVLVISSLSRYSHGFALLLLFLLLLLLLLFSSCLMLLLLGLLL